MPFLPDPRRAFTLVNSVLEPLARSPWTGPLPVGAGLTVLETLGRRSGAVRERPLLSVRVGDRMVMGTVRRPSDWVANVRARPDVHVWVDGRRRRAVADVVALPVGSIASVKVERDRT